jgi:hypothetical protein
MPGLDVYNGGLNEQTMPPGEIQFHWGSSPTDDRQLLLPSVYRPATQTVRIIAEDAGSIFDSADGSGGDDDLSLVVESTPHRPAHSNIATIDRGDDSDEKEDLIRGDLFFPTVLPSDLRRSPKAKPQAVKHNCSRSAGFFQREPVHMPKLAKTSRDHRDKLDRHFQLPARNGTPQYIMSIPLLGDDDDTLEKKHKRRGSFGRVLNVVKGKGSERAVERGTAPRNTFMRRHVLQLDAFLEQKGW